MARRSTGLLQHPGDAATVAAPPAASSARALAGGRDARGIRPEPVRGLFGKYVLCFVGLVVFVLSVNGALEMWFSYREITGGLVQAQSDRAETVARQIERVVLDVERQIGWATRTGADTFDQRRAEYTLILQQAPNIVELAYLDGAGKEQIRVSRATATFGAGTDYSGEAAFTEAKTKRVWFGPVRMRDGSGFITVAMRHTGRIAGVTLAEVDLEFLHELVRGPQIGKAGYTYVVGPQGRLLARSDRDTASAQTDLAGLPQVAAAVRPGNGPAGPVTFGRDLDNRSVLAASAPVPHLGAFIFVEQPLGEALRPLWSLAMRTAGLLAVALALAVLAGLALARHMITPIRALQAGALRLGAGDFSQRIEVATGDEIEALALEFNRMADRLQDSYSRLERDVEERTRELVQSVRELKALEEVGRAVASSLDPGAVLATVVRRAVELAQADAGAICSYDGKQGFRLAEAQGLDPQVVESVRAIDISDGTVMGEAVRTRETKPIPDLAAVARHPLQNIMLAAGFHSALVVPLVGADEVLGVLVVLRRVTGDFPPSAVGLMQTFAHQSALAMRNARLYHELAEKNRQLAAASEHKSQFFANMSHELRTPLNAILGYTELIVDGIYGETSDKVRGVLERVQANGKHLLGLINDVLDLTKIEAGQLTLAFEDYSMKSVVESVVAATQSLALAKGIALEARVADDLPMGRGDERRLAQVLLNIVGNAIKFTDAGSVEIRAGATDGVFELAVRDTGPGIAREDQARIFEDFQQVDNSATRRKGGTGLGLAISRRLVEMHGGSIRLESVEGVGSTFFVTLPVRADARRNAA